MLLALIFFSFPDAGAQEPVDAPQGASQGARPASTREAEQVAQSTIRGRALFDDSGNGVRRAAVMLFTNLNHPVVRKTVTNARGEFRFRGVGAGTYFVVADAPGIISRSGFQISDLGLNFEGANEEQPRVSVDGKSEARVDVRVRRGGTITGAITYGDGEPAMSARIVLYRRLGEESAPYFTDPVLTDDRGIYRVEGLPPGEYFVGAIEKNAGGRNLLPRDSVGLAAAYYPSAKSVREAKAVQLAAGGETKDVNITLAEDDLRSISGIVRWRSTRQPVERANIMIQRKDDPSIEVSLVDLIGNMTPPGIDKDDTLMRDMSLIAMASNTTPSTEANTLGRWTFTDIPSGKYILTVFASLPAKKMEVPKEGELPDISKELSESDRTTVSQRVEVAVSDEDLRDVTVELSEGGRISGMVIAEDTPATGVRIFLEHKGMNALLKFPYSVNQDGTFVIEGVPAGEVRLDVRLISNSTHYVKSVTYNGLDLMREPLRLAEGEEISGVRVTLGRGQATLSGYVTQPDTAAHVGGAGVLLIPVDEKLWPLHGSRLFGRANAEGAYTVSGAPGDYLVFTWSPKDEPAQAIEDYVRSHLGAARRISLQPDENRKADLMVNASNSLDKRGKPLD